MPHGPRAPCLQRCVVSNDLSPLQLIPCGHWDRREANVMYKTRTKNHFQLFWLAATFPSAHWNNICRSGNSLEFEPLHFIFNSNDTWWFAEISQKGRNKRFRLSNVGSNPCVKEWHKGLTFVSQPFSYKGTLQWNVSLKFLGVHSARH